MLLLINIFYSSV
ncbi:hypothetical protein EC970010_3744A, partial [Escherichia coli 97.0010]